MPAEHAQLESVGGDSDRYDAELRPELMRRAIAEIQDAGIEVDIWKIEGVDERSDCEMLVAQARTGGRDGVVCVVLGRGADDAKVDHWLDAGRPGRRLHRLRDRPLDLVGPAQGLRRRQDRALRRRAQDRRELPALRGRLRARQGARQLLAGERRCAAMKMRQSLADWEQAFVKEITLDRHRRDSLRRTAEQRARQARSRSGATSAARCASCCSC